MIKFSPPKVMPYAPASQPVASVAIGFNYNETVKRIVPQFILLDAKGRQIQIDYEALPQPQMTVDQANAVQSALSAQGRTLAQELADRLLPVLETCYGLKGGTVE